MSIPTNLSAETWTTATVYICAAAVTGLFAWIVVDIVMAGIPGLSLDFLWRQPVDGGRSGGIGPILVSTLAILFVCMLLAVPLSCATAIYLVEYVRPQSPSGRRLRFSLDILAGVPSIVFGLFGNIFFCQLLGLGYSIAAGGLTLACMILPFMIRTTEQGLRQTANRHSAGALALSLSRWTIYTRILIPAALPAISTGLVLGLGRATAETAALLFTSGYVDRMPESVWDSGRALSVHIYDLAMNVPGGTANAYTTALIMIGFLFVIYSVADRLRK